MQELNAREVKTSANGGDQQDRWKMKCEMMLEDAGDSPLVFDDDDVGMSLNPPDQQQQHGYQHHRDEDDASSVTSPPSLAESSCSSLSSSSYVSCEESPDSIDSICYTEDSDDLPQEKDERNHSNSSSSSRRRRSVSFAKKVAEVREYSLTVGDHPLCFDGLPLSLDWDHSNVLLFQDIQQSRERTARYEPPKRLSFDERRQKLFVGTSAAASSAAAGSHPQIGSSAEQAEADNNGNVSPHLKKEQAEGDAFLNSTSTGSSSCDIDLMISMLHHAWSMNYILAPPDLHDIEEEDAADTFDEDPEGGGDDSDDDNDDREYLRIRKVYYSSLRRLCRHRQEVISWRRNN